MLSTFSLKIDLVKNNFLIGRSNSSDSAIIFPFNEFDFDDKISIDSESSQFKFVNQNTSNTMNSNSQMSFRGNSTIYSNIWSHSLKTTSGSCPSLETPSVIISDHSTNHYEEVVLNIQGLNRIQLNV
jgi:hypothetical protein